MPHRELADGMLILVGGAFILSPGFVLDAVGIAVHPAADPADRSPDPVRPDQPQARRGLLHDEPGDAAPTAPRRTESSYGGSDHGRSDQGARPGGRDDAVVEGEVVDDHPDQPR